MRRYTARVALERAMSRHRAFLDRARYPSFDGLRALSIVPVVFHHATPRVLDGVLGRGPLGVDLFFAISGFLITTLLLREREAGGVRLGAFFVRRALRIFPLYYVVLALFVLHAVFVREPGPAREHFLRSLPLHATYTSNWLLDTDVPHPIVFGFGWSLATEEQFYAVWPVVLRFVRRLRVAALVMLLFLALDVVAERWAPAGGGLAWRMARSIATPICLGALLALVVRRPLGFRVTELVLGRPASSLVALGILVLAAALGWPLVVAHLAMVALVGACAITPSQVLAPLLESTLLCRIGAVSYGIYLLNVPAVVLVKRALGEDAPLVLVFALAFALSFALATLAHRLVERPFDAWRARLRA